MGQQINPIIELAQLVQVRWGENIEIKTLWIDRSVHPHIIKVKICLPADLPNFKAKSTSKKKAKQKAAKKALKRLRNGGWGWLKYQGTCQIPEPKNN